MGATDQDELLLFVSSSEPGAIAERLQLAAPQLQVRSVRGLNGRLRSSSAALVVIYESANAPHRPPSGMNGVPTIVITERPSASAAVAAIEQGVDGYLPADISGEALRAAVAAVIRGEPAYSRQTLGIWLRTLRTQGHLRHRVDLTPRQSQILDLIATGATDKEIAATIGVRTATAQKHVARLLKRLGVRNRAAAVASLRPAPAAARHTVSPR